MTSSSASRMPSVSPWDIPVVPPPDGQKPDFDQPTSVARVLLAINVVFLTLAIVSVGMRFVAHVTRRKKGDVVGWDGYMCILAAMASVVHTGLTLRSLDIGLGRHWSDIHLVMITHENMLIQLLLFPTYILALCFAKTSVLLLYLRLFQVMDVTRCLIWTGLVMNMATSLGFLGIAVTDCVKCANPDAFPIPFCKDVGRHLIVQAAINVFLDFYLLIIPMQQTCRLRVSTRKKMGLAAIFGVGSLACVVSSIRLGWTIRNEHQADQFWAAGLTSTMTVVEVNATIIAPCLVFLPGVIKSNG